MKIEPLARLLTGFLSYFTHNSNADKIEEAFANTLSLDGSSPNQMGAALDMGGNRIVNVGAPRDPNDAVRVVDVTGDAVINLSNAWDDITNKPTTFTPSAHTHPESDVTGLVADLATKAALSHTHTSGSVTDFNTAVDTRILGHTLLAGTNVTLTPNAGAGTLTISASSTAATAWASLTGVPSTFPPSAHTHPESDVTSLASDLAGKANVTHGHSTSDISGFGSAVYSSLSAGSGISITSGGSGAVISASGGGGSFPHSMYPAWENGITTSNSASTNTANLQALINTITGAGGGTIWFFTPGPYQINSTITLKSNVEIRMSPGALFSWVGSSSGIIFQTFNTGVLTGCYSDLFINEGGSFSGICVKMHSAYRNVWNIACFGTQTSSGTTLWISADSSGTSGFSEANNAFNKVRLIHMGTCGTLLRMDGLTSGIGGNPQVNTLNNFEDLQAINCLFRGIKLDSWSDTNQFTGQTRLNMTGSGSIGVIVNEGRGVAGVYNTHFDHLAVDTFGSGLSRYGVVLQESKGFTCDQFYQLPAAENAQFFGTNATSYEFRMLNASDQLQYLRKNVV